MRLFFALWPDNEVRQQINFIANQAARKHTGKLMKADNLHLTLAFLGNVTEQQHDCIVEKAGQIEFSPFDLCLDRLGSFPRAKVLWLGSNDTLPVVNDMAATLRQQAQDCEIETDNKFHPHVTLMRKVHHLHDIEMEPVHWHVEHFHLVQSFTYPEGVQYKVIRSW